MSEKILDREWLVTNGLGGYASGTVAGACTRRYHGLLVAALPAPHGRIMMLNRLSERLLLPGGREIRLDGEERPGGALELPGAVELCEFRLEMGLPVWRYDVEGVVLEKRLVMPNQQNTTLLSYRLISGAPEAVLTLTPLLQFRSHDEQVAITVPRPYRVQADRWRFEVHGPAEYPVLKLMMVCGANRELILDGGTFHDVFYRVEHARGYQATNQLYAPGRLSVALTPEEPAHLLVSAEDWERVEALTPGEVHRAEHDRLGRLLAAADPRAREGLAAELVLAADQFIITPSTRVGDATRAQAEGDQPRTVIAGYHWFTDWGRDTMISLEGLTLVTGRQVEAGWILRTFARHVRDGLIPNMFPEGEKEGLYHTADATLWFFHALHRYLQATGDEVTLHSLLPVMEDILEHHQRGTAFGIGVDPADGLLRQGAEGYQLTWMDAKVDGWVVTPRRGKAVEINALYYNALRLTEGWVRRLRGEEAARPLAQRAELVRASFNRRFWYEQGGYLHDVVDREGGGDDPNLRPNQLLALSLDHPVLDRDRWAQVMETVTRTLVTPLGLRTLSPDHPDYKASYDGDLRARDAAYHQGTVWAWLVGPLVDAWLKLHPDDRAGARRFLSGFEAHLQQGCVGSISEVFDAEPPFRHRGCVAQAWSVAEVLRALVKTAPES